ncbi:MAG: DUF2079 domain-containing protein, partial [Flavobacteriales bacterium]
FALLSFPNHYLLRTYALDLGMFNHALYDFSQGRANYFLLNVHGRNVHYFSDHFSPITLLYAPFRYIFGSWTLLIIQWLGILAGGWGMFRLAELKLKNILQSSLVMFHFFSIWGIVYALSFDFHNNVMAAMFVPWLFYFMEKKARTKAILMALLIMLSKENMALWLVFLISGYGMLRYTTFRAYFRGYLLPSLLISVYFILVMQVFMPAFSDGNYNGQTGRYAHLGATPAAILYNWFSNPLSFLSLWVDLNDNAKIIFGYKAQVWLMLLLSGGIFVLRRPAFFWMILPILAQKFFSGDPAMTGITHHYSIEFVPVLSMALLWAAAQQPQRALWYSIPSIVLTLGATVWSMDHKLLPGYNNANLHFYGARHYRSVHPDPAFILQKLKEIPDTAAVSASSELTPHLALRRRIYHFPVVRDASYIVLISAHTNYYPLGREEFFRRVQEYRQQGFRTLCDEKDLLILARP